MIYVEIISHRGSCHDKEENGNRRSDLDPTATADSKMKTVGGLEVYGTER